MPVHDPHTRSSEEIQQNWSEASSTSNHNDEVLSPEKKKARLLQENVISSSPCRLPPTASAEKNPPIRYLINDYNENMFEKMPISLCGGVVDGNAEKDTHRTKVKIGQDLNKLRRVLDIHGLHTTKISSPREAVSIYKESCRIGLTETEEDILGRDGKEFLLITFGLHPQQEEIEKEYEKFAKNSYCVLLFCQKLKQEYCTVKRVSSPNSSVKDEPAIDAGEDLQRLYRQIEETHQSVKNFQQKNGSGISSQPVQEQVNSLIEFAIKVKGKRFYRKEEWRKEYQRICVSNSTISNAYIFLLQSYHDICIKDIYLKLNKQEPKFERITIYLYDPAIDYGRRPDFFSFLPGLRTIVAKGPDKLVSEMIDSFWTFVFRKGYYPPSKLQGVIDTKLRCFFLAGITPSNPLTGNSNNLPLPLKANFVPTVPFSIYLHGKAGAGMCFSF